MLVTTGGRRPIFVPKYPPISKESFFAVWRKSQKIAIRIWTIWNTPWHNARRPTDGRKRARYVGGSRMARARRYLAALRASLAYRRTHVAAVGENSRQHAASGSCSIPFEFTPS